MAFPAPLRGHAINLVVETKYRACALDPSDAGRIGVKQGCINCEVLPIIGDNLATRRYISQHKKLQM